MRAIETAELEPQSDSRNVGDAMPNQLNVAMQIFLMSLPHMLACVVGLVVVSILRQRAAGAATTAMCCLIAMLVNTLFGVGYYALIQQIAGNVGGENFQRINMAVSLGRQLIEGAALVGLVYAVIQDRVSESDNLPELDEWSNPK